MSLIGKIWKVVCGEFAGLFEWMAMHYPRTLFGLALRKRYWARRLRKERVAYMGFGARITGCELLRVGERFVLSDHAVLEIADSDPVFIGNDVAIANGAYLRSANHRFDDLERDIQSQGHESKRLEHGGAIYSIVIEDDVWIGARAIILTGAHIGRGSIIAAGAVVSSTIPPLSVVAGNPARVVANRQSLAELKRKMGENRA